MYPTEGKGWTKRDYKQGLGKDDLFSPIPRGDTCRERLHVGPSPLLNFRLKKWKETPNIRLMDDLVTGDLVSLRGS